MLLIELGVFAALGFAVYLLAKKGARATTASGRLAAATTDPATAPSEFTALEDSLMVLLADREQEIERLSKLVALHEVAADSYRAQSRHARGVQGAASASRHKVMVPDHTRRHGYWFAPLVQTDSNDAVDAAVAAASFPAQICFTGFSEEEKVFLADVATQGRFRVMTGVAKHLTLLCVGENPGPQKVASARARGVMLVSAGQFERVCIARSDIHGASTSE